MEINPRVFDRFPVLTTERLTLRGITAEDAQRIFDMRSNGRVNRFIARNNMSDPADSVALAERTAQAFRDKKAIGWAGLLRDNREIIGSCGFNQIDFPNLHAEIGGELAPEYWGKNIALEAFCAILQFGLDVMHLHTIEAKVSPENRGAIFLLGQCGFHKEAHYRDRIFFNGRFMDMAVYTLIRGNEKYPLNGTRITITHQAS